MVSIRLLGFDGFPKDMPALPMVAQGKAALASPGVSQVQALLAPDFEIYRGGISISYNGPAEEEPRGNRELQGALFGSKGLKEALDRKDVDEDPQMRTSQGNGYYVVKFPEERPSGGNGLLGLSVRLAGVRDRIQVTSQPRRIDQSRRAQH